MVYMRLCFSYLVRFALCVRQKRAARLCLLTLLSVDTLEQAKPSGWIGVAPDDGAYSRYVCVYKREGETTTFLYLYIYDVGLGQFDGLRISHTKWDKHTERERKRVKSGVGKSESTKPQSTRECRPK